MKLRHRNTAAAAFAILLAALVGCTTATPYQPYRPESVGGVHGGYSEQRLAPDRYLVRFHGNELTSRDRVEGYMLYRAAELAVHNSFDSFQIVERHTEHDVETYVAGTLYIVPGTARITIGGGRTGAITPQATAGDPDTPTTTSASTSVGSKASKPKPRS